MSHERMPQPHTGAGVVPERELVAPAKPSEVVLEGQAEKPVAQSASSAGESGTVQAGEARPAAPKAADDVLTHRMPELASDHVAQAAADAVVLADSKQRTRRAFVGFTVAAAAGFGFYRFLDEEPEEEMIPRLLRRTFRANAEITRAPFRNHALAPTYPISKAQTLRVNGVYGLKKALMPDGYRLQIVGVRNAEMSPFYVRDVTAWDYKYAADPSGGEQGHHTKVDPSTLSSTRMAPAGMEQKCAEDESHSGRRPRGLEEAGESTSTLPPGSPGLLLKMEDFIPRLQHHELVLQFKCIEGWSEIVQWAGVRFADFLEMFPPALIDGKDPRYVYMETPDGDYYVGYDLNDLLHPQALLVTEMMGGPLTQYHGAPLRLYTPAKYGYKQIKRIGLIAYTNTKPDDYWTELGYDWYGDL
jgi:hypothetical protein